MGDGALYVGTPVEGDGRTTVDADDLTTHGVIVGMTGSGKTGLGIIALEEALLQGIPTLVLDPKGDMANLCLTFPDFAPADFRPWIDPAEAEREGRTPDEAQGMCFTVYYRTWCFQPFQVLLIYTSTIRLF